MTDYPDFDDTAFDNLVFQIAFAIRHKLPAARRDLNNADNVEFVAKRAADKVRRHYVIEPKPGVPLATSRGSAPD